jgi:hypothetical protein
MSNLRRAERLALGSKTFFQAVGTVTTIASPILGSVEVTTTAAGMRVLDFEQLEILFPIGAFFRQRRRTIANFNPLDASVIELPGLLHISQIFVACNGSSAQRTFLNRSIERRFLTWLDFGCDQISHV